MKIIDMIKFNGWCYSFLEVVEEAVGKINIIENTLRLLEWNVQAIKKVFGVCITKKSWVFEACAECFSVSVILNSLDNVSKTFSDQVLFGNNSVNVRAVLCNAAEISLVNISWIDWMSHNSLVIWNWPCWCRHHSQVMVPLGIHRGNHCVLCWEGSLGD